MNRKREIISAGCFLIKRWQNLRRKFNQENGWFFKKYIVLFWLVFCSSFFIMSCHLNFFLLCLFVKYMLIPTVNKIFSQVSSRIMYISFSYISKPIPILHDIIENRLYNIYKINKKRRTLKWTDRSSYI